MMIFAGSPFITLPGAVLIAAPVTWPPRRWIARNPWPAAFLYATLGAAAGAGISWLGRSDGNSVPLDDGHLGPIYGAAVAIALVWVLRKTRDTAAATNS